VTVLSLEQLIVSWREPRERDRQRERELGSSAGNKAEYILQNQLSKQTILNFFPGFS